MLRLYLPRSIQEVDARITEHAAYGDKFLVVDFKDVAAFHRVAEDVFVVESLAQVYIEDYQRIVFGGDGVEKTVDGVARDYVALCE